MLRRQPLRFNGSGELQFFSFSSLFAFSCGDVKYVHCSRGVVSITQSCGTRISNLCCSFRYVFQPVVSRGVGVGEGVAAGAGKPADDHTRGDGSLTVITVTATSAPNVASPRPATVNQKIEFLARQGFMVRLGERAGDPRACSGRRGTAGRGSGKRTGNVCHGSRRRASGAARGRLAQRGG